MKSGKKGMIIITIGLLMSSLMINIHPTFGQMWLPRGEGIYVLPMTSCSSPDALYLAYIEQDSANPADQNIIIYKWNGLFGVFLPKITIPNRWDSIIPTMCWYKNELYVGGNYDSIKGLLNAKHIVKFDGQNWKNVGKGLKHTYWYATNVYDFEVYKNELYVAGFFNAADGMKASNIAKWNGTSWGVVGTSGNEGTNHEIHDLIVYEDTLYVGGLFDSVSGIPMKSIAKWDGTNWINSHYQDSNMLLKFEVYKNEIYASFIPVDSPLIEICKWKDNKWQSITKNLNKSCTAINSFQSFNDSLYLLVFEPYNNPQIWIWDGSTWNTKPLVTAPKMIEKAGHRNLFTWRDKLFLSGLFENYQSTELVNLLEYTTNYGILSGSLYIDSINNCIRDSLERGIEKQFVLISPGSTLFYTDNYGYFKVYIDTGTYKIQPIPNNSIYKYWHLASCNPTEYIEQVRSGSKDTNNDFAYVPPTNVKDLRIFITGQTGYKARLGKTENYSIVYENIGSHVIDSGTVIFELDSSKVKLKSSKPSFSYYTYPKYYWNFVNLKPMERRTISLGIKIDTTNLINDIIWFNSNIIPTAADSNMNDNFDTLAQKIVSSFDPNDKQCFPDGNITPQTSIIDYHIRFQNTGNHMAYKVWVVDTISESLSLTKILLKTASHHYELGIKGNVLIWTFNNIMLPDSTSDEPNSHGYISYAAYIKPGLAIGTKITNKAYIYFDYQLPITTRSTLNIITKLDDIEEPAIIENQDYKIYPNPASGQLNIICLGKNQSQELYLMNSLGQMITSLKLKPAEKVELDISNLPNGLYLIRDMKGEKVNKFIVNH